MQNVSSRVVLAGRVRVLRSSESLRGSRGPGSACWGAPDDRGVPIECRVRVADRAVDAAGHVDPRIRGGKQDVRRSVEHVTNGHHHIHVGSPNMFKGDNLSR